MIIVKMIFLSRLLYLSHLLIVYLISIQVDNHFSASTLNIHEKEENITKSMKNSFNQLARWKIQNYNKKYPLINKNYHLLRFHSNFNKNWRFNSSIKHCMRNETQTSRMKMTVNVNNRRKFPTNHKSTLMLV